MTFIKSLIHKILNKEISNIYNKRFDNFNNTPKGVFWNSKLSQDLRLNIILDKILQNTKSDEFSIADIGCGYGSFADYLNRNYNESKFNYEGFDINPKFIKHCRSKFSEANLRFIIDSKPSSKKDFVTMSGTYNLATTTNVSLWEQYLFSCLSECWSYTKTAMIFNLQTSTKSKISSQNIYYANASKVIDFCVSKLGPTRVVRDSSLENDATFTVVR